MKDIVQQLITQIEEDQKLSPNTKSAYKSDLNDLINYTTNTNTQIADLNQEWVRNYLKYLEETNAEKNSFNRRASTFRIFLKFLYKNKLAPTNYSLMVDNQSSFLKTNENFVEVEDIKKAIEDAKLKTDEKLILTMIGKLGLTGTQIVSLNTHQVDFENKSINISDTQKIDLPYHIFSLLREYLLDIRPHIQGAGESLSLFLNKKGKSLTELDIYKLIKDLSEQAGLQGRLTTRSLKKSLGKKIDILSIQREITSIISPEAV